MYTFFLMDDIVCPEIFYLMFKMFLRRVRIFFFFLFDLYKTCEIWWKKITSTYCKLRMQTVLIRKSLNRVKFKFKNRKWWISSLYSKSCVLYIFKIELRLIGWNHFVYRFQFLLISPQKININNNKHLLCILCNIDTITTKEKLFSNKFVLPSFRS